MKRKDNMTKKEYYQRIKDSNLQMSCYLARIMMKVRNKMQISDNFLKQGNEILDIQQDLKNKKG